MITVKKLVPYEKSYETQLFDQAVVTFIAAHISGSPNRLYYPKDYADAVAWVRKLATVMMDARNV